MFYDTCALLHDAKNIFNKDEDIKYQARIVTRLLSEKTDKYVAILYNSIIEKLALKTGIPINNDLKIICSAWYAKEHYLEKDETLVFSTKDLNCSLLASSPYIDQYEELKKEMHENKSKWIVNRNFNAYIGKATTGRYGNSNNY